MEQHQTESVCYDVRCFRRASKGAKRHGIWIMTKEARGMFIHGDYDSIDAPKWNIGDLVKGCGDAEEITPQQALEDVANWPEAARKVQSCFDRHRKPSAE